MESDYSAMIFYQCIVSMDLVLSSNVMPGLWKSDKWALLKWINKCCDIFLITSRLHFHFSMWCISWSSRWAGHSPKVWLEFTAPPTCVAHHQWRFFRKWLCFQEVKIHTEPVPCAEQFMSKMLFAPPKHVDGEGDAFTLSAAEHMTTCDQSLFWRENISNRVVTYWKEDCFSFSGIRGLLLSARNAVWTKLNIMTSGENHLDFKTEIKKIHSRTLQRWNIKERESQAGGLLWGNTHLYVKGAVHGLHSSNRTTNSKCKSFLFAFKFVLCCVACVFLALTWPPCHAWALIVSAAVPLLVVTS